MEKILINDLSFAYPDEPNRLIIKDINLEIEEGEFVVIVDGKKAEEKEISFESAVEVAYA